MASSYTGLGVELMVTGENAGTWGDNTNNNLNLIQQAIAGYEAIALSDGGTVTLASPQPTTYCFTASGGTGGNSECVISCLTPTCTPGYCTLWVGYGGGGAAGSPQGTGGNGAGGCGNVYHGGGGGGAGAVGENSPTSRGGAGGIGLQYSAYATATSTGDSGYYAGGGGGGVQTQRGHAVLERRVHRPRFVRAARGEDQAAAFRRDVHAHRFQVRGDLRAAGG